MTSGMIAFAAAAVLAFQGCSGLFAKVEQSHANHLDEILLMIFLRALQALPDCRNLPAVEPKARLFESCYTSKTCPG